MMGQSLMPMAEMDRRSDAKALTGERVLEGGPLVDFWPLG